jgi:hypothetical protein
MKGSASGSAAADDNDNDDDIDDDNNNNNDDGGDDGDTAIGAAKGVSLDDLETVAAALKTMAAAADDDDDDDDEVPGPLPTASFSTASSLTTTRLVSRARHLGGARGGASAAWEGRLASPLSSMLGVGINARAEGWEAKRAAAVAAGRTSLGTSPGTSLGTSLENTGSAKRRAGSTDGGVSGHGGPLAKKNGWRRASAAVRRAVGSNVSNPRRRSLPASLKTPPGHRRKKTPGQQHST